MRVLGRAGLRHEIAQWVLTVALVGFAALGLPVFATRASAQGNWWDGPQTGTPDYTGRRNETDRPPQDRE